MVLSKVRCVLKKFNLLKALVWYAYLVCNQNENLHNQLISFRKKFQLWIKANKQTNKHTKLLLSYRHQHFFFTYGNQYCLDKSTEFKICWIMVSFFHDSLHWYLMVYYEKKKKKYHWQKKSNTMIRFQYMYIRFHTYDYGFVFGQKLTPKLCKLCVSDKWQRAIEA